MKTAHVLCGAPFLITMIRHSRQLYHLDRQDSVMRRSAGQKEEK